MTDYIRSAENIKKQPKSSFEKYLKTIEQYTTTILQGCNDCGIRVRQNVSEWDDPDAPPKPSITRHIFLKSAVSVIPPIKP
jgi:hypothetical protein